MGICNPKTFLVLAGITVTTVIYFIISLPLSSWEPEEVVDDKDRKNWEIFIRPKIQGHFSSEAYLSTHGQDVFRTNINQTHRKPACLQPELDINGTAMQKFFHKAKPIVCDTDPDWVTVHNSTCQISAEAKKRHGEIKCTFRDVIRKDDNTNILGNSSGPQTEYTLQNSDYVQVKCSAKDGKHWSNVVAGIRYEPDIQERVGWQFSSPEGLPLSIFIWGYDSLSRLTYMRKLQETYKYFVEEMDGVVLEGYNVVGDGTTQNLLPLFTGSHERELPETRKRMGSKAHFVNVYPLIWKEYQQNGYATAFIEDWIESSIFTYRLKGFDESPADHYMRSFFIESNKDQKSYKKNCIRATKRNQVVVNYVKEMFTMYENKPKFIMSFQNELSHDDCNLIESVDADIKEMLQYLKRNGYLNHTLVILLSDHGHRSVPGIRDTIQGKQEERLPMFGLAFPPWFNERFPLAMQNLRSNIHRLTTPFDVHETLKHILHFNSSLNISENPRSCSLFHLVPLERTCSDVSVEPHWCSCLDWKELPISDTRVQQAAETFVKLTNEYIEEHRNICETVHLHQILWAKRYTPTDGLRKFRSSDSKDMYDPILTANTKITQEVYEIKLHTTVGNLTDVQQHFEATLNYDVEKKKFYINKMEHVSRTDRYGHQADCVPSTLLKDIRKFCFCKGTPSTR